MARFNENDSIFFLTRNAENDRIIDSMEIGTEIHPWHGSDFLISRNNQALILVFVLTILFPTPLTQVSGKVKNPSTMEMRLRQNGTSRDAPYTPQNQMLPLSSCRR